MTNKIKHKTMGFFNSVITRFIESLKIDILCILLSSLIIMSMTSISYGSQGRISLYHSIHNPDAAGWGFMIAHASPDEYRNISEGLDEWDRKYNLLWLGPHNILTGIFSEVDGNKLMTDVRPTNSTSTVEFYLSFETRGGSQITIDTDHTLYIEIGSSEVSGWDFPGENVYITINGHTYDVKTTSEIALSRLVGTFNSGDVLASGIITFVPHPAPSVDTQSAYEITSDSAELWGQILDDGGEDCEYRFSYWKDGDEENVITTDWEGSVNKGDYCYTTISGLESYSLYYFQAEASNSAGSTIGDIESFVTYPNPDDPPAAFPDANSLVIQNFVKQFQTDLYSPNTSQGLLSYFERAGNLNGIDVNDVFYTAPATTSSKIVSLIINKNAEGQVTGFYELVKDARPKNPNPNDPNNLKLLEASIYNPNPNDPKVNSENYLRFWLANKDSFKGKPLTIQQVSSVSNIVYPVWDIRAIIDKNNRILPLNNLVNQTPNIGYAYFTLSTSRQLLDLNEDEKIDLIDYSLLLANFGITGIFRSDIAKPGTGGAVYVLGLSDGKVDNTDKSAFIAEYNKIHPDNPIIANNIEDFETGNFSRFPWNPQYSSTSTSAWFVTSNEAHTGKYCAKAVDNTPSGDSALTVTLNCVSGNIKFWFKVSATDPYDTYFLRFYIDGVFAGHWGNTDWTEVSFPVTAGTHKFMWWYAQRLIITGISACIDDIEFPI
jgi:hypothetical protein